MTEDEKNYKHKQQDHTELNGDGNRERGRYGEDLSGSEDGSTTTSGNNTQMSEEEIAEQQFKERLEQLRKRDPFIYR